MLAHVTRFKELAVLNGQSSRNARDRRNLRAARELRSRLMPVRTEAEIGAMLGITKQAVEQAELRGLAKLVRGFAKMVMEELK